MIKGTLLNFKRYWFLITELISRDFKVKYKRSVLGILWSLLNPLLTMAVMSFVFSNLFETRVEGTNFIVYLMTGIILFNYFSQASTSAMTSVVENFTLINKIYIPKYVFPINIYYLLLPVIFFALFLFTLGIGLLLSCLSVFLRDIFHIYGIILTLWNYLTPIFYSLEIIPAKLQIFMKINPMYQFINATRSIVLYGECPDLLHFLIMALIGIERRH